MKPFLKQVADHYYSGHDAATLCFIFPNRRSMTFFRSYLASDISDPSLPRFGGGRGPLIMPEMLTVSDFFYRAAGKHPTDRIRLLLELYGCYRNLYPSAESLDEFISWGDVLLADFADVDKYLVDPAAIFRNVADFKDMQDDLSHLSPEQRKAVDDFLGHFRDSSGLRTDVRKGGVKDNFLKIWDILLPLYESFNKRLSEEGMAYDGMVSREFAQALSERPVADILAERFPHSRLFVFVGLNALNECERKVLSRMRDASLAEFCWDYSSPMIKDLRSRPSEYMKRNVSEFPQLWELDADGLPQTEFNVMGVSSGTAQAKMLPFVLEKCRVNGKPDYKECAIVLPDQGLLMPVLNSIPPEYQDINVTMGYPMKGSAFWSLLSTLSSIQMHVRWSGDRASFYYRQAYYLFSNPLFVAVADEDSLQAVAEVKSARRSYIDTGSICRTEFLNLLFRPVLKRLNEADALQIREFASWQKEVISYVATHISDNVSLAVETEFARRCHSCVTLLQDLNMAILPETYIRLVEQLVCAESVPFEGEPLKGLQVMGPLETRALDFRNVVILSCNEGVFPRKNQSVSFIPPELRKGFGLPTNEFKDAVLAYSFYRLIQRAENVWLLYDTSSDKMRGSGEESRYIKQLQYHFRKDITRYVADSALNLNSREEVLEKPRDMAVKLKERSFSVSMVKSYLNCPVQFYYNYVLGLAGEEEISESLDVRTTGNVYHAVMQALYLGPEAMSPDFAMDRQSVAESLRSGRIRPMTDVSAAYLRQWLGMAPQIKAKIRALIKAELGVETVSGRDLVQEKIILGYVMKTLERDLERLGQYHGGSFRILGLELPASCVIGGYRFKGFIDRLDSFSDDEVRVLDYKTGSKGTEADVENPAKAAGAVDSIFNPDSAKKPLNALQLYIYDRFVSDMPEYAGRTVKCAICNVNAIYREEVKDWSMCDEFRVACGEALVRTLDEICDTERPFRRTGNPELCRNCNFKTICGR